jgi:hypothetical protein
MGKSWQAAMTFLERKFPQRWGRRVDVTSAGNEISRVEYVIVDPETGTQEPYPNPAPDTTP